MGICYIVGAGCFVNAHLSPSSGDYIIAADNGFSHLKRLQIRPDIVIGDFDSLEEIPLNEKIIQHPIEKDDTDMMLAIKAGLELGYRTFIIYGGLGGRLDHTFANIQMLIYLSTKGSRGYLLDGDRVVTAITNEELTFSNEREGILSVFCAGDVAKGVNLKGLKYELDNAELTNEMPLGISNEFTGCESAVSVGEGSLIIMWTDPAFKVVDAIENDNGR